MVTCVSAHDPQLARLADAIAQRVGQQRFHVWFNNSTRLDLRQDGLEIAVPNDFISEWIGKNFTRPIQEAAHEVLGTPLQVRFSVVPELFEVESARKTAEQAEPAPVRPAPPARGKSASGNGRSNGAARGAGSNGSGGANGSNGHAAQTISRAVQIVRGVPRPAATEASARDGSLSPFTSRPRLRHDLESFVVG